MRIVDLRSDTVTTPTEEMRNAMAKAVVGDDVLGEDPTVRMLEEKAAGLLGKESALFTNSGTMSNQIAVMCFCRPGDEVIVPDSSHIYNLEVGGLAALGGVQVRPLVTADGIYPEDALLSAFRQPSIQTSPTGLVCFENSADLNLGLAVDGQRFDRLAAICKSRSIPVYLDGARLFNTAVALKVNASNLARSADAVAVCLTKGLSAPIGSVLAGSREFIAQARRIRQRIGGGWRQAGIIAAAGIVALDSMVARLSEDHALASTLAEGLIALGLRVRPYPVQTNILQVDLTDLAINSQQFADRLRKKGVLVKPITSGAVRMVTHKDVHKGDIQLVLQAVQEVLIDRI